MTDHQTAPPAQVFFTKHPIMDSKRKLWGYELLASSGESGDQLACSARETPADGLASSTFIGIQQAVERGKRLLIGFDERCILEKAPYAFSPDQCAVKFHGNVTDPQALIEALQALKKDGFLVAVDALVDPPQRLKLFSLADIITLDMGIGLDPKALPKAAQKFKAKTLAERVRHLQQYSDLSALGFDLFQGAFFKEPEIIAERRLTSHQISRINILRLIEVDDPDFDALAKAIQSDVSVSFRLLSYLNSAAFGFPQKIQSIKQAIMVLGVNKMKNWLRAVLLADMASPGDTPQELVLLSLQRAKFLESVTKKYDYWDYDPGSLFLLGLFSLIDAILGMPMRQVVDHLPLDQRLKSALNRESNNEYQPLLELVDAIENADWPQLEARTQRLSFDQDVIKGLYTEAMTWAGSFFSTQASGKN